MVWAQRIWLRLQTLFRRNGNAQQLDDEIQFHLDQQIGENLAAGMSPHDARYAAIRTFGNPTLLKEEAREAWGWIIWLEQITQEFRYAPRRLRMAPTFTIATPPSALAVANYVFFQQKPSPAVLVGGILIVTGAIVVSVWK